MKNETNLSQHKRFKKQLQPPLLQLNMTHSSWIDDRLPEMLWAVLVIGNLDREKALNFFRSVATFVKENPECFDITLSGISLFPAEKRKEFIAKAVGWSEEVRLALRPLTLLPNLPAIADWKSTLGKSVPEEDWQKLGNGVARTFWHQSEEATDCRWIKFLCEIVGGKLKFSSAIKDIQETLRGVFEYPNYGDLRHIRPFIRAGEIAPGPKERARNNWSVNFWKYCYDNTRCVPEETVNKKLQNRKKQFSEEMEETRKHYINETRDLRNKIIDHFFATTKTSSIDSRHEGAFGLALYGATLFIEIVFYRASLSITGRTALRQLFEAYVTFKYLLKKERKEPRIWDGYRSYGTGQLKLIYLKLKELKAKVSSLELEEIDYLANEDKWIEFVPITLGHWDSENLRAISEEVGLKDFYDKFYDYTSGFVHSTWGAIRESVYQKCINPLHRYHRVPIYDLPLMPSVTNDARELFNGILECLSRAYPTFDLRFGTRTDKKIIKKKKR